MAYLSTTTSLRLPGAPDQSDTFCESGDWLLDSVKTGDPKAVALLYYRHHNAVRAFANRLLGEETAAEDLTHEVFMALPRALRRYRGDASLRTFLIGIASNRAKQYIRSAARRRAAYERYRTLELPPDPTPELLCSRRELASTLQRALDTLPVKQRVVFVLSDVEEKTSTEVAEIVGVSPATVRTRLFHARKKLRRVLQREGEAIQ
jgi:RNA polymerase sigma-70 factor (ECF subfamily)